MKRWFLPFVQLVVGLVMIPQAFLFDGLMTREILTGRIAFDFSGPNLYTYAWLAASLFIGLATVLCLLAAGFLIRKPTARGTRLSIGGTICYWIYIVGHLVMISTLPGGLRGRLTLLDAVDYPIGVIALAVAIALFVSTHDKMREGLSGASPHNMRIE